MKNKKLLKTLIIIGIILILLITGFICWTTNLKNQDDEMLSKNETKNEIEESYNEVEQENVIANEVNDESTDANSEVINNSVENSNNELESSKPQISNVIETKENKQDQTKVKTKATTSTTVEKKVTSTSTETKKETPIVKTETTENKKVEQQETKQEVKETHCTNNSNHSVSIGNSGKWFTSKDEAVAYYNSQTTYWSSQWENGGIDDNTYYKKCPAGYEVWSCMYCNKWTVNFYYR